MKKKALFLLTVLVFSSLLGANNSICVLAADSENEESLSVCKGDPGYGISHIPLEQQLEEILSNPDYTDEHKEAAKRRVQEIIEFEKSFANENNNQLRSYSTVTLGVTAYTQEEYYYCGPATTRQTLKYLGSIVPGGYTPPSQSSIANSLGTTIYGTEWNMITNYINSYNFMGVYSDYFEHCPTSVSNMESYIYTYALTRYYPMPPILQIDTGVNSTILGYITDGHYMNISGMKTENNTNYFQVTDPNRGRLTPALPSTYYIKTSDAYNITINHWAEHYLC